MNTTTQENQGFNFRDIGQGSQSKTVAFLFGAVFNILANTDYASLIDYSFKAVIGGIVMMLFKLLGDYVSKRLFKRKKVKNVRRHVGTKKLNNTKNDKG